MQSNTQSKVDAKHCVITGDVNHDRAHYKALTSELGSLSTHNICIDLGQLHSLNLVTLGLIAWMIEQATSSGRPYELINTTDDMRRALKLYQMC